MKQYLVELIGTFFLTLAITLTSGDSMAVGLMLMAMIYMGGHISGGHFNPAVTLAVWLRGGMIFGSMPFYMLAQIVGALLTGAFFYALTQGNNLLIVPLQPGLSSLIGMAFELLMAFVFCSVVLAVATTDRLRGTAVAGLIIGLGLAAAVSIPLGVLVNPALGVCSLVGALITGDMTAVMNNLIAHIAGPLVGAVLAAVWFKYLNPSESGTNSSFNIR